VCVCGTALIFAMVDVRMQSRSRREALSTTMLAARDVHIAAEERRLSTCVLRIWSAIEMYSITFI
jgi:nitroreductase